MFHSRSFIAHAQKARKVAGGDPAAARRSIEEQFVRGARHVPEELAGELVAHCFSTRDEFDAQVQALADLLDLLFQQYDEEADPLTETDWRFLRDAIDQYASDLDMPLIQYVMERVVSHHAL